MKIIITATELRIMKMTKVILGLVVVGICSTSSLHAPLPEIREQRVQEFL